MPGGLRLGAAHRRLLLALLAVTALAASSIGAAEPAGAQPQNPDKQATATGTGGAVASLDPHASQAGIDTLRRGGNAIDAAVATSAMLGLTRPYDGSIGGGGFMVIYLADEDRVVTIDHREKAPGAFQPDTFIDPETGEPIPFQERVQSGLGVGVPGVVAGWEQALDQYGTMPFQRVLQPAITVAQRGFTADEQYASRTASNLAKFSNFTSTRETFLTEGGEAPEVGDRIRNRDLADTYRSIARGGADAFYEGEVAEAIADAVQNPPVIDEPDRLIRSGLMEPEDLAAYDAVEREPAATDYRGFEVYGMGPPSSGGSTIGEALNILEGFDMAGLPREEALHNFIEASAIGFADRNAYLGDEDFVDVPMEGLLSQGFADERREIIGEDRALRPIPAGDPYPYQDGDGQAAVAQEEDADLDGSTTHLTTSDSDGNVVSYTFTIEQIGGSGITVPDHGFLLNNELTDFSPDPEHPANAPAGDKRPRSSMSPTLVMEDGEPVAAFGSPGGARIITAVLQVAVHHLDFGLDLPDAIAAPRLSNTNTVSTLTESELIGTPEAEALEARNHTLSSTGTIGNVTGIAFLDDGRMQAAAEPTRLNGGSAMVVTETD